MIVIGCAPSSGSSLLAKILNRHSKLSCGPETALFARMDLMLDWEKNKKLLYQKSWKKLRDYGWHRYRGVKWDDDFYPWSREQFIDIVNHASTFQEFVKNCKLKFPTTTWIEKTPSNVYSFAWLREHMQDVRLIKIIRDPYDSVASLIARGYDVIYAVGLYLLHNAAGIFTSEQDMVSCRYEDLVVDVEHVISNMLSRLSLSWEPEMLTPENLEVIMPGWNNDETGPVSQSSVGRFELLDARLQDEIIHAIDALRINLEYKLPCKSWSIRSVEEICQQYNYRFRKPLGVNTYRSRHKSILLKEKLRRTFAAYPTRYFNFPLEYQSR